MDKHKRSLWLFFCAIVLTIVSLLPTCSWPVRMADAFDQPAGDPGTAADPVLTVNSLRQYLDQHFAVQKQQLDTLTERLSLVSQGLQELHGGSGSPFPDLYGHWAASAVSALKARQVITGYPDGNFHPEDRVTRAAMAVMLTRIKNLAPNPGAAQFPDVSSSYWAAGAIGAAKSAGYLQGYPDGTFRPEQGVSRAEAAVLLDKAFSLQNNNLTASFTDVGNDFWAASAIRRLAAAGIISGYPGGAFRPIRIMSRGETAVLLAKVLPPQ